MMKRILLMCLSLLLALGTYGQKPEETEDWLNKPEKVTPGECGQPPSDAIILYGGPGDIEKWTGEREGPARWKGGEVLTIVPGTGGIRTKQAFGDMQLHLEWRVPADVKGTGQDRGNSGVYLMGKYEIQVLDSYENETYYNGMAGSVYKQYVPLVNPTRPPGEWQSYDIIFRAPRFREDGSLESPAYVTVLLNGVLVQNHVEIAGPTDHIGRPPYVAHPPKLPLMLQDHDHSDSFRNIWVRELS
jgi:hypothetical protein